MLAVIEAKELIESNYFSEIESVYTNNLPVEIQSNDDKTIALITDVSTSTTLTGNNDFYALKSTIELQIFYKLDVDIDIEELHILLIKVFRKDGWLLDQLKDLTVDPDTLQLSAVFYFTKIRYI